MSQAEIGLVGLGVMGSNLALNIASRGFHVAVYNRNPDVTRAFKANAGKLAEFIIPCETLEALSAAIRPPRPVIIMVTAGNPVDQVIGSL
ncbi:MAG: NAD(P)-binding domain-containing protein, partial [Alphaproteobacteria bacterium]|nr:NAD(P)-binding domain-containing protein [Alphaproteobacteria bacterium]